MTKKEKSLIVKVIGLLMDGSDKNQKQGICLLGSLVGITFPDTKNQKLVNLLKNVSGQAQSKP
jgi:proteasome assembly chaperone (PAC2) family protein